MLARVIDVTKDTVYLEIDRQLRFKSQYIMHDNREQVAKSDNVNFSFFDNRDGTVVIINDIVDKFNTSF